MNRIRSLMILSAIIGAVLFSVPLLTTPGAFAAQGVPLPGSAIPKFVDPLPGLTLVDGTSGALTIRMKEFLADVMPSTFIPLNTATYSGTYVWGYLTDGNLPPTAPNGSYNTYINPVVLAKRGTPTEMKFINELPSTAASMLEAWKSSTDQTLHWADPGNLMCMGVVCTPGSVNPCCQNYSGTIPAVTHLHGGEVPPQLDGGPDAWFTSDGIQGHAYYSKNLGDDAWSAVYRYPNSQEAANIWFHDHALGITRLNVYAGLAGGYLLSDPYDSGSGLGYNLPTGLGWHDIGGEVIIPIVIQDRKFDVDGQLYFDNIGINPEHPFWVPEFVGDTIVVNGKVWPTIGTALAPKSSKRYRFLFLNGSNARTYELFLVDPVSKVMGPPMWVIGTDGGYLDAPAKIDPNALVGPVKLTLMPGERYDVVIDFNDAAWRTSITNAYAALGMPVPATLGLILRNTGNTPYPKGAPPQGATLGQIVQIFVGGAVADSGYDPASGVKLRGDAGVTNAIPPIERLPGTPQSALPATTANVHKFRQLTLNEVMSIGGPLEVLVNNTKWDGHSIATDRFTSGVRPDFTLDPSGNSHTYYSELPDEGTTEVWDVINLTADAHPIHLHLVQFQLISRQNFNFNTYNAAYNALFPGSGVLDPMTGLAYPPGAFIGGFGPPVDYNTGKKWSAKDTFGGTSVNTAAVGGNPDINEKNPKNNKFKYLQGMPSPPQPYEEGWKDTVVMYPGQVTRIVVRWAPTDLAVPASPKNVSTLYFPFNPNGGHGYVWHCHIIDHEDNEMMRPDSVTVNPAAPSPRPYLGRLDGGTDF